MLLFQDKLHIAIFKKCSEWDRVRVCGWKVRLLTDSDLSACNLGASNTQSRYPIRVVEPNDWNHHYCLAESSFSGSWS